MIESGGHLNGDQLDTERQRGAVSGGRGYGQPLGHRRLDAGGHRQPFAPIISGRIQTTQDITQLTNRLYALVRGWGYLESKKLLTKTGRAWLETVQLPAHAHQVLTESLHTLASLQERETAYEKLLCGLIQADPIGQILLTIPYVGPFTAFILRAEIGEITRFASANKLIAYSGLIPRVLQTGNTCRFGPLTKHGNAYLRFVAVLFAQNCVKGKKDTPFKRRYYRLNHTHDQNELKVMLARDFLAVVYHMWQSQTPWRDTRRDVAALQASGA